MTNKEQGLLDDLLKIEEGLTDWELGFIGDMDKQRAVNLSPKQQATFNRIAKRFDLGQIEVTGSKQCQRCGGTGFVQE